MPAIELLEHIMGAPPIANESAQDVWGYFYAALTKASGAIALCAESMWVRINAPEPQGFL